MILNTIIYSSFGQDFPVADPSLETAIEAAQMDSNTCASAYDYAVRCAPELLADVALLGQTVDNHLGVLLRQAGVPLFKC